MVRPSMKAFNAGDAMDAEYISATPASSAFKGIFRQSFERE